jgi:YHYH protein
MPECVMFRARLPLAMLALMLPSVGLTEDFVPLGDGKVSSMPVQGSVFSCETTFRARPGPAVPFGPWIHGDVWYPAEKPFLAGNVLWAEGGSQVSVSGDTRQITSRGVPDHGTGAFPIRKTDPLYQYDRNPNEVAPRPVAFDVPAHPQLASGPSCLPMGPIGVALSGAVIFNALDAAGLDAAAHEIQDQCHGHPARRGLYHYHSGSDCLATTDPAPDGHAGLVGYALDGFGIFGPSGAGGDVVTNADLDACHGHTGPVLWDGAVTEIYHYHLTAEYPYTLGCFAGTPR